MVPFFSTISLVSGVVSMFKKRPDDLPLDHAPIIMKEVGDREHGQSLEEGTMDRSNPIAGIERTK